VTGQEIDALARAAGGQKPTAVFTASRSGLGTNGVALAPVDAMPLTFGEPSFANHVAIARARGLVTSVLPLSGLALDVDTSGDLLVVGQKIVSKAEGRVVHLETVTPSTVATAMAAGLGRDPRLVEIILRESRRVVRMDRGILITETHHGWICANAGVDQSN